MVRDRVVQVKWTAHETHVRVLRIETRNATIRRLQVQKIARERVKMVRWVAT